MGDPDDPTVREPKSRERQPSQHDQLPRGATLGRYVVEELVGEGGMGVVYAAFDPELHRRVALKLLQPSLGRSETANDARARLLREAQAIARLSHPNVVHVYDVGTLDDHVFLALEFIDGENLPRWLKRARPTWREVLRVFIAAGRGLAAAHAAGLIHRDIKPDNVLIGKDGRVLVSDFGLARAEGDHTIEQPTPSARGSQPLLEPLTQAGTLMGTPGYTAPEYLQGRVGDARADQFSFAASLYAGLYKKRAYPCDSFATYAKLLEAGFPEPPSTSDVPTWVRRAIERGMAREPRARFPSVDALLAALLDDPAARRHKWLVAGGVMVALGIATGATIRAVRTKTARGELCTGAEQRLAGVWDASKRAAMQHAFLATDRPFAQQALTGALKRLDDRAHAWAAMSTETCEATRRRGEQTEAIMTLRLACLDGRLRELGQLVDVFAAADGKVVERAISATSALSPLESCADVKGLLAAVPPPPAQVRARVFEQRGLLARSKALFDGGKFKEAAAVAQQVVDAANTIDYRPLEAEALYRLGETQVFLQAGQPAVDALRAAMRAAEASKYDEIRARSLAWLVGVIGYDLEKPQDGLALAEDARAALERIGGNPTIEGILESSLGRTYFATGDYPKMLEHHQKALALRQKVFGEDDPNTAASYNNVAVALKRLGRNDEALATYRKAQAIKEKLLGAEHPDTAMGMSNLGGFHYEVGDVDAALPELDSALASAKKSLPAKHATNLVSLANKAALLGDIGRYDEARATYDELIPILNAEFPASARLARALASRAEYVLAPTGHGKEALADAEHAEAILMKVNGKPTDDVAAAILAKGRALEALRKPAAALSAYQRAIDINEHLLGKDDPQLIEPLTFAARVQLAHKPADAIAALERGIAICEHHQIGGLWLARQRFMLARALPPTERTRAIELATQAKGWYATSSLQRELADVETWLTRTATRR